MYKDLFTQAGLTLNEAVVYEYLLRNGESAAQEVTQKTTLNKGVVYIALSDLVKKGLASEKMLPPKNPNVRNKKKISYFAPEHPERLRDYLESQKVGITKAEKNLEANIDDIISSFKLVSEKPGIRYYEGIRGIEQVINDTLSSKTAIYTYADMEEVNKYIKKINDDYAVKREKLSVPKKVLLVDSPYTHTLLKNYPKENLDIRFLKSVSSYSTVMQIYDNKISYVTLSDDKMMGVIIENENIYKMHKTLFEDDWNKAE